MEVSYNLRYQKFNFSNKQVLDKEGEAIIYGKGFRLKGKGAGDKGELINFSEIKEFYYRDEKLNFITFNKEKYILSSFGTLFDQFLVDIYKARNEFLTDALFMRGGKLKAEFDGHFERQSKFAKLINKGEARLKLYEKSMVVVPPRQDAFAIHYDFVQMHEFDELDYLLKIVMDDGVTILISQLGDYYEPFEEKLNELLGGLYETLVNDILKELFPYYRADTLLKLAFLMKGGKAVSLKQIQKIDPELAKEVDDFVFEDEIFTEKMGYLREMTDESGVYYGISKDEAVKDGFVKWAMVSLVPENVVAFSILPRWKKAENGEQKPDFHETFFYKIIMEKGTPEEKVADKIREIQQTLVVLHFAKDPCFQDKRELKHSPYQYAIRKLPYLRILRKSFVGRVAAADVNQWHQQAENIIKQARLK